jgi:hypothetical protein
MSVEVPFSEACALLERAIAGSVRQDVAAEVSSARTMREALGALRESMSTDRWRIGSGLLDLGRMTRDYDARTREEGFHALHDWDGIADHVNPDIIPVDVLNYIADQRGHDAPDEVAPAVLLDYYFMHLLSLLTLRIWDEGDADGNLDRVGRLLTLLQSGSGSGHRFGDDAEILLLIATAHYEMKESGYDLLLGRVRSLNWGHRRAIALEHASSMGCHLRFGFEATYGRDTTLMRSDNVADYPWLCFSVATTMEEYVRLRGAGADAPRRRAVVEALLGGLSADPRALLGAPPSSLAPHDAERARFREMFLDHRADLLAEFEACRPGAASYSPLSFFFNFAHNVVKGAAVDALLWSEPWPIGLNDLLRSPAQVGASRTSDESAGAEASGVAGSTGETATDPPGRSPEDLAKTLMAYARTNPQKIRGRPMPVIVYDPEAGYRAYRLALRRLQEA